RGTTGDDHLRVIVTDTRRAGLADEIRGWFEHVVDVQVRVPDDDVRPATNRPDNATPTELFSLFLDERGVDDDRLVPAFEALLDDLVSTSSGDDR
ncbi:MAG: hypothetical protein OSA99_15620, partial [Acidimicrobiales bacterium]|nr:hypothetical protein [Acidimicrobiales bacterium]